MTKRLFYSFSLVLLASASVFAEQIKVDIPFSFHLGTSTFPSGVYTVDTNVSPGVLRVRSEDFKSSAMSLSNYVQSNANSNNSKLVFHKYGDQYFLYQVWAGGGNAGRELPQSRPEVKLAANRHVGIQAVLARR